MKSFQDRLFKDFDVEKVPGKNGKIKNVYVYKGDYAEWKMTEEERGRYKSLYIGSAVILVLLFLWKSLRMLRFPFPDCFRYLFQAAG